MRISENLHMFPWDSMTVNNCNTYLIDGPTRVLVDPGHRRLFDHVARGLDGIGLKVEDIGLVLCTHAHPDHIEAVEVFRDIGTPVAFHQAEWQMLTDLKSEIRAYFELDVETVRPDFLLREGELDAGGLQLGVFHTPGHSPGAVCLYWPDKRCLFSGDLVFREGLGRTDLPGGNGALLKESILRMAELDVETLLPGHGDVIEGRPAVQRNFDILRQEWFAYV